MLLLLLLLLLSLFELPIKLMWNTEHYILYEIGEIKHTRKKNWIHSTKETEKKELENENEHFIYVYNLSWRASHFLPIQFMHNEYVHEIKRNKPEKKKEQQIEKKRVHAQKKLVPSPTHSTEWMWQSSDAAAAAPLMNEFIGVGNNQQLSMHTRSKKTTALN